MRISKLLRGVCVAALLVLFFTLGTAVALADTMTLTLGVPSMALVPYPGPYATVTVDRTDSTHASITFASLIMSHGGVEGVRDGRGVTASAPYGTTSAAAISRSAAAAARANGGNGGFLYLMGSNGSADLNVNGSYTLGAVNETNSISRVRGDLRG